MYFLPEEDINIAWSHCEHGGARNGHCWYCGQYCYFELDDHDRRHEAENFLPIYRVFSMKGKTLVRQLARRTFLELGLDRTFAAARDLGIFVDDSRRDYSQDLQFIGRFIDTRATEIASHDAGKPTKSRRDKLASIAAPWRFGFGRPFFLRRRRRLSTAKSPSAFDGAATKNEPQSYLLMKTLEGLRTPFASRAIPAVACLLATATPSLAEDATGTWLVEERDAQVQIEPCGEYLCGRISWLKGPPKNASGSAKAKVGQQVLWDMKEQGNGVWLGKALNPRDGNTYSGRMAVSGDGLKMTGCVLGGLICKTASWVRIK